MVEVKFDTQPPAPAETEIPQQFAYHGGMFRITAPLEPKEGETEPHRMIISVCPVNDFGATLKTVKPESWIRAQLSEQVTQR